MTVLSLMVGYG